MKAETETRGSVRSFRDLDAWREAHALVVEIYKVTKSFPKDALFGLVNQMRRCAVSITSNIAEGFNRASLKEKLQFYAISLGSTAELQSQLDVALDVGYVSKETYQAQDFQSEKVHKIIIGLIKSTRSRL